MSPTTFNRNQNHNDSMIVRYDDTGRGFNPLIQAPTHNCPVQLERSHSSSGISWQPSQSHPTAPHPVAGLGVCAREHVTQSVLTNTCTIAAATNHQYCIRACGRQQWSVFVEQPGFYYLRIVLSQCRCSLLHCTICIFKPDCYNTLTCTYL